MSGYDILVFPDVHAPFHDRIAWNLGLKILDVIKPKVFRLVGDFADSNAAQRHVKDPRREFLLRKELRIPIAMRVQLDARLAKVGCTDKGIWLGNHDMWMEKRIREKAPEFDGMLTFDRELGFTANGWKVTPYQNFEKIAKLHGSHEWGYCGKNAVLDIAKELRHNSVSGHTHGAGVVYTGNAVGEKHSTMLVGWMGDPSKAQYMARHKRNINWMHGVGLIHVDSRGNVHQQFIPFVEGCAVVWGQEIRL